MNCNVHKYNLNITGVPALFPNNFEEFQIRRTLDMDDIMSTYHRGIGSKLALALEAIRYASLSIVI